MKDNKAKALILSLLSHVIVAFGLMFFGGSPAPEPPIVVIDFSMATATAEAGESVAREERRLDASSPRSESLVEQRQEPERPREKLPDMPEKVISKAKLTREKSKKTVRPTVENKEAVPPLPVAEGENDRSEPTTVETPLTEEADEVQSADSEAVMKNRTSAGNETRIEKSKEDNGATNSYDYEFVRSLIIKNLSFPATARRMGLTGKIVVSFILKEDGRAVEIAVIESSGHDILDDNVVAAIRRISPFPRPEAAAQIVLPIVFHLK